MNLWMMSALRMPRAIMGPTLRIISLTTRYALNTIFSDTSKFSSDFQTHDVVLLVEVASMVFSVGRVVELEMRSVSRQVDTTVF